MQIQMQIFKDVTCTCGNEYTTTGHTNPGVKPSKSKNDVVAHDVKVGSVITYEGSVREIRIYSRCPKCNEENINIIQEPLL